MPLAAALPTDPNLRELLGYQINGLIVVFVALGGIWGLLELSGLYFRRRATAPLDQSPKANIPEPIANSNETSPEILAALAAAVHISCGANARITSVVAIDPPESSWGKEGRRQHHATHRIR